MKKKIGIALLFIFIFAAAVGAWFYGYYHRKSNDNLPALFAIAEMDEADVNTLLMGYKRIQLIEVWGEPDGIQSNEDIWEINDSVSLRVNSDNKGEVVICGLVSNHTYSNEVTEYSWGITLTAEQVTATGLTILCNQTEGYPTGELNTGSWYVLEKYTEKGWKELEMLPQRYDVAWTAEAWIIPMEDTVKWDVNWEWLYGKLRAGKYRIGKEIMDFRAPGDYEKKIHYAEFEIME